MAKPTLSADQGLERRDEITRLRLLGHNPREISEQVGISTIAVNRHLRIAREQWIRSANASYEEMVATESAKLDTMERVLSARILSGSIAAVEAWLKVVERRARLFGLDHSDLVNAKRVELESAKVDLLVSMLASSLAETSLSAEQQREVMLAIAARPRTQEDIVDGEVLE